VAVWTTSWASAACWWLHGNGRFTEDQSEYVISADWYHRVNRTQHLTAVHAGLTLTDVLMSVTVTPFLMVLYAVLCRL